MLPSAFTDLERWVDPFAVESDDDRSRLRLEWSLDEITAFHQAMFPRFAAIMEHLAEVDPRSMSDEQRLLVALAVTFVELSAAVEHYGPTGTNGARDIIRFEAKHGLLGLALAR